MNSCPSFVTDKTRFFAGLTIIILSIQLFAITAWTVDAATDGPRVVVFQLSEDSDTTWAVRDIVKRLSSVISDDPFLHNRLTVRKVSNLNYVTSHSGDIAIYITHGGPLGMVVGDKLVSWKSVADMVMSSEARLHLFAACESRRIVPYGTESSGKVVYTVRGARPAEVSNVDIAATVMLALGEDEESVRDYRMNQLTRSRDLIQSGASVHIMDFEQVLFDSIEQIDDTYSDSYTVGLRSRSSAPQKCTRTLKDSLIFHRTCRTH